MKKKYSLAVTTTTSNGNSSANTPTNTPKKTPKKAETTPKSGLKSSATVLESSSDDEDDDEKSKSFFMVRREHNSIAEIDKFHIEKETEQDRGSPISKKRKVSNAKVETRLQSPFNETEKANTETPESKTEVNGKDNNDTVEDEVEHAEPVEPEAKTFSV